MVTAYNIDYVNDANQWQPALTSDGNRIFPGNTDKDTPVTNTFQTPIVAKEVQLSVEQFSEQPNLRWGLFGCGTLLIMTLATNM